MASSVLDSSLTPSRAFHNYDSSRKGYLSEIQFRCALAYLQGVAPSEEETDACFQFARYQFEKQTSSKFEFKGISLRIFQQLAEMRAKAIETQDDRVKELFQVLDRRQKGYITIQDFREAVGQCVGPFISSKQCELLNLFFEIDSNRDGKVSLKDFQQLVHF